jgi:hypothetical protein
MPESIVKQERFLQDVEKHQLTILQDDGVYRHLKLSNPDSSAQHFNITTWPNYLCISGDMGCFVFSRLTDMFNFFRADELGVNARYWRGKLEAPRHDDPSVIAFDDTAAENDVKAALNQWVKDTQEDIDDENREEKEQLIEDVTEKVKDELLGRDEIGFYHNMRDWDAEETTFDICEALCDHDHKKHKYHFIWCCYAIVWAIQQYDKSAYKPSLQLGENLGIAHLVKGAAKCTDQ